MTSAPFKIRASSAACWVVCAAFVTMHAGAPDLSDVTIREEGTAFHWLAHMMHLKHVPVVGMQSPNNVAITEQMIDDADEYIDWINAAASTDGQVWVEQTLAAPSIHADVGGTADCIIWIASRRLLIIVDAKYGYRRVEVWENWQLIVYACAVLDALGVERTNDEEITIQFVIYQPRTFAPKGPFTTWKVQASELRPYFNQLRYGAEMALRPEPKQTTGPHCNHCNGRLQCRAFNDASANVLEVVSEFQTYEVTPIMIDSQLTRIRRAQELLDAHSQGLEAAAEMLIGQGKQLRNFEFTRGNGRLSWNEGAEARVIALGKALNVKVSKEVPVTPTQATKLLGAGIVSGLATRSSGALKLTRIDPLKAAKVFS